MGRVDCFGVTSCLVGCGTVASGAAGARADSAALGARSLENLPPLLSAAGMLKLVWDGLGVGLALGVCGKS